MNYNNVHVSSLVDALSVHVDDDEVELHVLGCPVDTLLGGTNCDPAMPKHGLAVLLYVHRNRKAQ